MCVRGWVGVYCTFIFKCSLSLNYTKHVHIHKQVWILTLSLPKLQQFKVECVVCLVSQMCASWATLLFWYRRHRRQGKSWSLLKKKFKKKVRLSHGRNIGFLLLTTWFFLVQFLLKHLACFSSSFLFTSY